MRALRSGWMFRAGRRSRRLAGDGPRGDGVGKTGGGIRALAVARPGAATVAAPEVELRNACIALWMGVPRGATVATVRGRRPARRRRGENRRRHSGAGGDPVGGRDGGGRRARAAQCAHCALAGRPARRRLGENRGRCSSAGGDPVGGRDGGGRRCRVAQCVHCALAGHSARGGGRDSSRAAARAATAWANRRQCSSSGGDRVGGRDGGGRSARAAQCAHCALDRCYARGDGRDGSRAAARAATAWGNR